MLKRSNIGRKFIELVTESPNRVSTRMFENLLSDSGKYKVTFLDDANNESAKVTSH